MLLLFVALSTTLSVAYNMHHCPQFHVHVVYCTDIVALIALCGHPYHAVIVALVALTLLSSVALSTLLSSAYYMHCCSCPTGVINCVEVIAHIALMLLPSSCFCFCCHCHDGTIAVVVLASLQLLGRRLHHC